MPSRRDRRSDPNAPLLSRTVQLRFSDEAYRELQDLAASEALTVGQYVRNLVDVHLAVVVHGAQVEPDPEP